MARQGFVERREHLQRFIAVALARQLAAIGLHDPQRRANRACRHARALGRFLALRRHVEDQAGMQILEDRVPVRARQLVDRIDRDLGFARADLRPGRQQRGGQIGDRAAHRLGQFAARGRILLLLERPHAEHEPRDAIVLVDLQDALGEPGRFVDLAIGQNREEGAVEHFAVARIAAQRGAIIGRGRRCVALDAGMPGGQITAGPKTRARSSKEPAPALTAGRSS